MLVGLCPNPFQSASSRCRLRVCSKHFYNKKRQPRTLPQGRILGCHRLSELHFFGGVLFFGKEQFYVALRTKKFLHLVFRFAVVRVDRFLFRQQLGIQGAGIAPLIEGALSVTELPKHIKETAHTLETVGTYHHANRYLISLRNLPKYYNPAP